MAGAQQVSPETVVRMGVELVGNAVGDDDLPAVAALLGGLVTEMGSMRAMEVPDSEPATTYDPGPP